MHKNYKCTISYGKLRIPVYRVYAQPLTSISPIPESRFVGRPNTLFALHIDVEVFGENFLPAYTEGDNRNVVATDSMKNFVLRQALRFEGSTLEELLIFLGQCFLSTYAQMEHIRLTAHELPFSSAPLPNGESSVLFRREHGDFAMATMDFTRDEDQQPIPTAHQCARLQMDLFKVTGSAFTHFVQDEYTTLPERVDRPLFIRLNVYWTYTDIMTLLASNHTAYVASEQVRDLVQFVFDEFVSESIQHLVYEMGCRLLERFPQLATVAFDAQNHTRDLAAAAQEKEQIKVYTDPFTAFGNIHLTLSRAAEDIQPEESHV